MAGNLLCMGSILEEVEIGALRELALDDQPAGAVQRLET
jgi:hypothetical protein